MRKSLLMIVPLLVGVLLFSTCEQPTDPDTTSLDTIPPTVTITFLTEGSVSEVVSITCMSSDNEGVEKVELWVDGVSTGITDETEPYSLDWNTTTYEVGSHIIIVRSYDTSGNTTDSDPITLSVDNSESYPTPVELYPVTYQDDSFNISWSRNNDDDFSSYTLYESTSEDMSDETLIFETDERTDTTYVTDISEGETRYYKIVVEDLWGLQSESNIQYGNSTPLTGTYKAIMTLSQPNDTCYAYSSLPDSAWFFQLTLNTYQEYFWQESECWNTGVVWSFDMDYDYNMFHTDMFISSNGDTLPWEFGWELNGDSLFWYWIDIGEGWDSTFQCNGDYWDPVSVPYIIALRDDVIDFTPLCDTTSQSLINSRKKWIESTEWDKDGNKK